MKDIRQRIAAGERLLLLLDYDGTLVPIRKLPQNAVLLPARRNILKGLSQSVFVGIVTGRSLADIKRLVSLENIAYIGNHGLELSWGHKSWVHPQAEKPRAALKILLSQIEQRTARFPRLLVEDKGVTGSVHFRRVDPALVPLIRKIVTDAVQRNRRKFLLMEGKKVLEIRPNLDWDKGLGIQKLRRWISRGDKPFMIFIGDDRTDEDAFKALGPKAVTIHVGRRKETSARDRLADVDQVWNYLRNLRRALSLSDRMSKVKV